VLARILGTPLRRLLVLLVVLAGVAGVVYLPRARRHLHERRLQSMSLAQLEALVRERPEDAAARYQLARGYSRSGRLADASRELVKVVNQTPQDAKALNDLGVAYLLQNRFYEALLALQGATQAQPKFAAAWANLGRLHLTTKMPFTAERELEKAAALAPKDYLTLCDLGEAYLQTLNAKSARRVFEQARSLKPGQVQAVIGLGHAFESLGQPEEARKALETALEMQGETPQLLTSLARIRLKRAASEDDVAAAQSLLDRASRLDPEDPEIWYELGRIELRQKRDAVAIIRFRRALSLSPQHSGALNNLATALQRTGDLDAARRARKKVREIALRGREETRLEERLQRQPNDWDSAAGLAAIYLAEGKLGLAALTIRRLQDGQPKHPRLPELRDRLRAARSTGQAGRFPAAQSGQPEGR